MPGFVVYLYLYKNKALAFNALICLYLLEFKVPRISRTILLILQLLRDTLR